MKSSASAITVDVVQRRTSLEAARSVFLTAFTKSYTPLLGRVEGMPTTPKELSMFLNNAFTDDVNDITCNDRNTTAYIAKKDERVVGYLSVDIGDCLYLRQLAVCPNEKRRGIGRSLVLRAISNHAKNLEVRVSFRACNTDAERFYKSLGFQDEVECHNSLDSNLYRGLVLQCRDS